MVVKSRNAGAKKAGKVKVGKLKLNKETVRNLSKHQGKEIKGGQAKNSRGRANCTDFGCAILAN
jgi:hypothetical protein